VCADSLMLMCVCISV